MPKIIPYGKHLIEQDDIDAVIRVLQSDWLTCGPVVEEFERELAKAVNAKYAVACSNGTTALHLALLGLNIGADDVVLVPAITFLASANAARYVGADVVFVDVDPDTGLMTAETLAAAIERSKGKNLKAVVNVHLAGQCEDLAAIYAVARQHNLLIIEDGAHAIGTLYIDKAGTKHPIGANAFADITTFSFHPVKTMAMGEGGAITTNDAEVAKRMSVLRSHGMIRGTTSEPWYYAMPEVGFNYRISDINCALGLSQLQKVAGFKAARTKIVQTYDKAFSACKGLMPLKKFAHSDTAWHLYVALIDFVNCGKSRIEVMNELKAKGIGTQVHYIPLYKQPYYVERYGAINLPGAESYYAKALSLPLFVGLQIEEQQSVIDALVSYAG